MAAAALAAKFGSHGKEAEDATVEKNYQRRCKAVAWVDKEIRKLIDVFIEKGGAARAIKFGALFELTMDNFEALSGTLVAAKKRGVVAYEGQLLMQKMHDNVVISLVKDKIEDSPMPPRDTGPRKDFFNTTNADAPSVCSVCSKKVYPSERISAVSKVFHKTCFCCVVCKGKLEAGNYCSMNGLIYCNAHYEQTFKAKGSYDSGPAGDKKIGGGTAGAIKAASAAAATPAPAAVVTPTPAPAAVDNSKAEAEAAAAAAAAEAAAANAAAAAKQKAAEAEQRRVEAAAAKAAAEAAAAAEAEAAAARKREADAEAAAAKKREAEAKERADAEAAAARQREAEEKERAAERKREAAAAAALKAEQEKAEAAAAAALKQANAAAAAKAAEEARAAKEKADALARENQKRENERRANEAKAKADKEKADAAAKENAKREADRKAADAKAKADREKAAAAAAADKIAKDRAAAVTAAAAAAAASAASAAASNTGGSSSGGTSKRQCSKCKKAAPNATAKFCTGCSGKIEDVWSGGGGDSVSTPAAQSMAVGGSGGSTASANNCKCGAVYGAAAKFCAKCGTPRAGGATTAASTPAATTTTAAATGSKPGGSGPAWMRNLQAKQTTAAPAPVATTQPAATSKAAPTCQHPGCKQPSYGKFCVAHAPTSTSGKKKEVAHDTAVAGMITNKNALFILENILTEMDDDDECALCYTKFSAISTQHHCGLCGQVFDDKCFSEQWSMCIDCVQNIS